LEQLERLAAGYAANRDETEQFAARVHHQTVRAKEERPLSPGKQRKADKKVQRQARKAAKARHWEAMHTPLPPAPPLVGPRCAAMTLAGHRCTLADGHSEGHMGVLPDDMAPGPSIGRTLWCRWQRHSDDFD
jgi:hypothetical protein